jgi:hypothetical protein
MTRTPAQPRRYLPIKARLVSLENNPLPDFGQD